MSRYAIAMLLALFMVSPTMAQPVMKADAAYGVRYVEERVVDLPQDQNKAYLTIFGNENDKTYRQVKQWFASHETLTALKEQCFYNEIPTTTAMYRLRYAGTVPKGTVISLQDAAGNPICEFGPNADQAIPMTPDALAKALNTKCSSAECFRRHHKQDDNADKDDSDPKQQRLPPDRKSDDISPMLPGFGVILLSLLVGGALGVRRGYKNQHRT